MNVLVEAIAQAAEIMQWSVDRTVRELLDKVGEEPTEDVVQRIIELCESVS